MLLLPDLRKKRGRGSRLLTTGSLKGFQHVSPRGNRRELIQLNSDLHRPAPVPHCFVRALLHTLDDGRRRVRTGLTVGEV